MPIEDPDTLDTGGTIAAHPALGTLSASVLTAVATALKSVELEAGESLFPEDDRIDALYIVRTGELRAIETNANGVESLVRTLGAGEILDQLQVLSGGTRPVQVRAH